MNKNINKQNINVIIEYTLLFFICLLITFSFGSRYLNEDNYNYAIEEMHAFDSNLYAESINVIGLEYSPRFFANYLMSVLIHILRVSWYGAATVLIRINYILYAIAAFFFALKITVKHRLLAGAMVSTCFMCGSLISLAFGINGAPDVFLGTAIPVALIGIVCVLGEKKRWNTAWIFLAVAGFLHVHEGIWAGCVVGSVWIGICIAHRKFEWIELRTLPIFIISLLLIVMPSIIHSGTVDEDLFVQIYAFIRTPHHLLLSAWGMKQIALSALLLLMSFFTVCVIWKRNNILIEERENFCIAAILALLWCILLAIEYFATEIYPISAIITMYLPKCFKYITILGAVAFIRNGFKYVDEGKYLSGLLLLVMPFLPTGNLWICIRLILFVVFILSDIIDLQDRLFNIKDNDYKSMMMLIVYVITFYIIYKYNGINSEYIFVAFVLIVTYVLFSRFIRFEKIWKCLITLSCGILVCASSNGFIFHISREGISYIGGSEFVSSNMNQSIYQLALDFKDKTDKEVVYLADPDSINSNAFQLISQRSCYALYKNTPSNKNAIIDWYSRILQVRKMNNCSAEKLVGFMDDIDVEYVLVKGDRFDIIEDSGLFDIISKNEEYAMYLKK